MTPEENAAKVIESLPATLPAEHRYVVAIAGPPASGKSTLAAALVDAFDGRAGLMAMDGFHFDDAILIERGDRARKGAPHTFDVVSYAMTLRSLRESPGIEQSVPTFDRTLELSRNCASLVRAEHQIVVTEGNYLLLNSSPWTTLAPLFDFTVWLDVPMTTIEERNSARWAEFDYSPQQISDWLETNDLPNARLTQSSSVKGDLVI